MNYDELITAIHVSACPSNLVADVCEAIQELQDERDMHARVASRAIDDASVLKAERKLLASEHAEQSRLLGMSGSREADLIAEVARLSGHIKHIGNDALRAENHELQTMVEAETALCDALTLTLGTANAKLAALEQQEPAAIYQGSGTFHFTGKVPTFFCGQLLYLAAGAAPQAQPHPDHIVDANKMVPLTDEDIETLAHRAATKYTHRSDPAYHSYGFVRHTLIDFARKILEAQGEQQ